MTAARILEDRLRGRLERLRNKDRFRKLISRSGIDLSSNDYLGMASHPRVKEAMIRALDDDIPSGSTGSRLLRGNAPEHEILEKQLALLEHRQAALIFNSGYDANVGVLSTLCGASDFIFSDAYIHASAIDGIRASGATRHIFDHNDMDHLESLLKQHSGGRSRFIVVESVYSMDGDLAPLHKLTELAKQYGALLIVDEAHATGVFGPDGAGLCARDGIEPFLSIHTCGKAWGSFGAFVACSEIVRDFLVNQCRRFIFTTALPPLLPIQWQTALEIIRNESWRSERALSLAARFRQEMKGIADTGQSKSQIVPLICGSDAAALKAAEHCQQAGFDIRAIRPPTVPVGTARLRIAFNALLTDDDLERLIQCCRSFYGG